MFQYVNTEIVTLHVVFIQCPYCHRNSMLEDAVQESTFCLADTKEGYRLKHDHAYYYQVY